MKLRSTILLFLMIVVPIAILSWLGVRLAKNEQAVIQQRFQRLLTDRLTDIDGQIANYLDELERSMHRLTDRDDYSSNQMVGNEALIAETLREVVRHEPDVTTLFVMDPMNRLVFPNSDVANQNESSFLVRANQVLIDKDLFFTNKLLEQQREYGNGMLYDGNNDVWSANNFESALPRKAQTQTEQSMNPETDFPRTQVVIGNPITNAASYNTNTANFPNSGDLSTVPLQQPAGWISWFWGRGVHLIYWQRRASGFVVGVEIDRARFLSNIIANLPETPLRTNKKLNRMDESDSLIRLVDSSSRTLYQWGQYEVAENVDSFCEVPVANPLSSWRLKYFAPIAQLTAGAGQGIFYNLITGLTLAAIGLGALGFFAWREYSRDMREAEQRVSFVNQVSHELKTPLTNIRMYAELLNSDLDHLASELGDTPRSRLDVIQSESQRLSRLIGNVLTFAGQRRKTLQLKKTTISIDQIIRETLTQFTPSLEQAGITAVFEPSASEPISIDSDAIEQIIGNLINNVEKYASEGKTLRITSHQTATQTFVKVSDQGPGVAEKMKSKIFQPFARASDSLQKAAGTGIGLSIARELTRRHGGELKLLDSDQGATFQLQLPNQVS